MVRERNDGGCFQQIGVIDRQDPIADFHVAANDLVVATHGRSIWVLDVTPLRQMTAEIVKGKTALFSPSPAIAWQR